MTAPSKRTKRFPVRERCRGPLVARRAVLPICAALGLLVPSCAKDLPPYGQVLVIVDTDVPAPAFAGRLRVDLYDERGAWTDSSDFPRPNPADWPTSFSLYTTAERRRVLVRLRAYPEGKVRDYLGERFAPRPTFEAPHTASSVDELCANPPVLEEGKTLRLRVGSTRNLTTSSNCHERTGGAALAAFDVHQSGQYTFGVVSTDPPGSPFMVEFFEDCKGAEQACVSFLIPPPLLPLFKTALTPGRRYLAVQDVFTPAGAFDVVVGFSKSATYDKLTGPDPAPPDHASAEPRLVKEGSDLTPPTEPSPNLAIDRLVLLDIDPKAAGAVHVLLHGSCLGTMAVLGTTDPHVPSIEEASSCVDVENERTAVAAAAIEADTSLGVSERGTFGTDQPPCPDGIDPRGPVACVPGGLFVLGTPEFGGLGVGSTVPERPAIIPTFWIDRYEVTVGAFRQAIARGLRVSPTDGPGPNPSADPANPLVGKCSYTLQPGAYEDHAVNCLTWRAARAFCQFRHGDLPTEAQWEFTAKAANRARPTRFPWGDNEPSCTCKGSQDPCNAAIVSTDPTVFEPACSRVADAEHGGTVRAREGPHGDVAEMTPGGSSWGSAGASRR
jgi:hypothetical protein